MGSFSSCFFVVVLCICVFLFAGSGAFNVDQTGARTWCIAAPNLGSEILQRIIDWYCEQPGVNCIVLKPGGSCYEPSTLHDHASVVLNLFYKAHGGISPWCPANAGILTNIDPSTGSCIYP